MHGIPFSIGHFELVSSDFDSACWLRWQSQSIFHIRRSSSGAHISFYYFLKFNLIFFQFKNKQTNQSLLWVKRNALQWSADAMLRRFYLFYISLSIYTVLLSIFRLDILNSVAVSDVYYHSLELWKMYNWIYLILLGMTRAISSIVHRLVSCIKASGCAIYQF